MQAGGGEEAFLQARAAIEAGSADWAALLRELIRIPSC